MMAESIFADFSLIKAQKADKLGNCVFHRTARNSNADVATASECTICEAEEVVDTGSLDPASVVLPSIYVDHVVQGKNY